MKSNRIFLTYLTLTQFNQFYTPTPHPPPPGVFDAMMSVVIIFKRPDYRGGSINVAVTVFLPHPCTVHTLKDHNEMTS